MTETPQELLREAARRIETVLVLLDTRGSYCPTCGRKHFENLPHARAYEQLTDTPDKLRRLAEKIEQPAPIAAPSQKEE